MSKLTESARGQECHVRIPGVCNGNPETTVLAHLKPTGHGTMGGKPPDICGVFACSDCHDVIDGRRFVRFLVNDVENYAKDGHLRTLIWWGQNGYL